MTQSAADREFALRHGHAPVAHKVVCVDFDGTLYPFVDIFEAPPPLPGAVEAMQRLKRAGFRLVILTSRLSPTWLDAAGEDFDEQRQYIESLLDRDGIPYDDVTAEKRPAEFYVDDKAVRFDNNWPEITAFLLWSRDPE